jgi:hypothetical protein
VRELRFVLSADYVDLMRPFMWLYGKGWLTTEDTKSTKKDS